MTEPGDTDDTGSGESSLRSTWARWRDAARARWQQHGRPLAVAAREKVFGVTVDPRAELTRERVVRVSESHLRRLLADQLEHSRRVSSGELHFEEGAIRVQVVLRRWRPVNVRVRFAVDIGRQDEDTIEVAVRRLGPSEMDSEHWLMNLLVRLYAWWSRRQGDPDPFDHLLLRRPGAYREGDRVHVPVPRAPITALAGKSRVLRWLAAYATFTSLTVRPGTLVVGFDLSRLGARISDMRVLRHLLAESAEGEGIDDPRPGPPAAPQA